mmetsp:Transcript_74434/g.118386  ORF Transcript_74434/g.118386 Transcript_74434/m.118386 type:complete len:205 (-) Transcript_74434:1224-1838(-)
MQFFFRSRHCVQEFTIALTHVFVAELLQDPSPSSCSHLFPEFRALVQLQNCITDGISIPRGHQESLHTVTEGLRNGINIAANHWAFESHGFTNHQGEYLIERRNQHYICCHVKSQDSCLNVHDGDVRLPSLILRKFLPAAAREAIGRSYVKDLIDVLDLMVSDVPSTHNQLLEIGAIVFSDQLCTSLGGKDLSLPAAHRAQMQN